MKTDYYTDAILGEWQQDKKGSKKDYLCYRRTAEVKLHEDYAMPYTDPVDYKDYKIHGKVILSETKLINVQTSETSFFRGVELTPETEKKAVIK